MVNIKPFTALRYDTRKIDLSKTVCPPYDVINQRQRRGYMKNSKYNIVRIELPETKGNGPDYNKAKKDLYSWIKKGILKEEKSTAVYIYLQEYKISKRTFRRYGILSLLSLKGAKENNVLPHEKVFPAPLLDRVRLMKKTKAHISPIFFIFEDKKGCLSNLLLQEIKDRRPDIDIEFDGARNVLWVITNSFFINRIKSLINKGRLLIADGHHRFKASTIVKDHFSSLMKGKKDGYASTLAYIVSSKDKGLLILPTHRAVKAVPEGFSMDYIKKRLDRYFTIESITADRVESRLSKADKKGESAFVLLYEASYILLLLKDKDIVKKLGPQNMSFSWKRLNVSILHNIIFSLLGIEEKICLDQNIYYYKDMAELIQKVRSGEYKIAVFLNPPTISEVEDIAKRSEKMPHKSTYFFPKPITGLVIHKF
jgi:uncharacterized protein (DUF1015 family)